MKQSQLYLIRNYMEKPDSTETMLPKMFNRVSWPRHF